MKERKKILILENDDFLREILGNLLHKKGAYILNGSSIKKGIQEAKGHRIHTVILSDSCTDYDLKHSFNFIKKECGIDAKVFFIHSQEKNVPFLEDEYQMKREHLSIEQILKQLA